MSDQWSSDDSDGILESRRTVPDRTDTVEDIVKRVAHVQRSLGRSQEDLIARAQKLSEKHNEPPSQLCLKRVSQLDFWSVIKDFNRLRGQLESLDTALDRAIGVREMFGKGNRKARPKQLVVSKWRAQTLPLRPDSPITEDEKPSKPGNMNWI